MSRESACNLVSLWKKCKGGGWELLCSIWNIFSRGWESFKVKITNTRQLERFSFWDCLQMSLVLLYCLEKGEWGGNNMGLFFSYDSQSIFGAIIPPQQRRLLCSWCLAGSMLMRHLHQCRREVFSESPPPKMLLSATFTKEQQIWFPLAFISSLLSLSSSLLLLPNAWRGSEQSQVNSWKRREWSAEGKGWREACQDTYSVWGLASASPIETNEVVRTMHAQDIPTNIA